MLIVPQNIGAPNAITIVIKTPTLGFDLTGVTAVHFSVRRFDGSLTTWVASIKSATRLELVAQYVFADLGEITTTGMYQIQPRLTVQGGTLLSSAVAMFVSNAYSTVANTETDTWLAANSELQSPPTPGSVASNTWVTLDDTNSPYVASALFPFYALDLTIATIDVQLWDAADGDEVRFTDVYGGANNTRHLTLTAFTGQLLPKLDGTYAQSQDYKTPNFVLRLKFSGTRWFPF